MLKLLTFITGLVTTLIAGAAFAVPVTWTLDGVTFNDGGTASGSFVYDANTNAYSAINITTTTGSTRAGATYIALEPAVTHSAVSFHLTTTAGGSVAGQPLLSLITTPKTNGGGTLPLVPTPAEGTCDLTPCNSATGSVRALTGGSITTTPPTPVPTMTEWAMILFGTILAGGAALTIQRRRLVV